MKFSQLSPLILVLFFAVTMGLAQDRQPTDLERPAADVQPPTEGGRPNLLHELGLSPDQLQRLREMNAEHKPRMEQAQRAFRDAVKALDTAIYADSVNEADVAARIKVYQSAQAEIASIRFDSELTVRQILTPDQLVKFRELRQRFEEERMKFRGGRRKGERMGPFRKMNRQNRTLKNGP
ncbi:MAG: periplasmic heavy metal sensor [Acidobacteriota bacterium]